MMSSADYKVPGGKLIRIRANVVGSKLASVKITGDFFLHPEGGIVGLEDALVGKRLEKVTLQKAVEKALIGYEAVGFSAGDMADALLRLKEPSGKV